MGTAANVLQHWQCPPPPEEGPPRSKLVASSSPPPANHAPPPELLARAAALLDQLQAPRYAELAAQYKRLRSEGLALVCHATNSQARHPMASHLIASMIPPLPNWFVVQICAPSPHTFPSHVAGDHAGSGSDGRAGSGRGARICGGGRRTRDGGVTGTGCKTCSGGCRRRTSQCEGLRPGLCRCLPLSPPRLSQLSPPLRNDPRSLLVCPVWILYQITARYVLTPTAADQTFHPCVGD